MNAAERDCAWSKRKCESSPVGDSEREASVADPAVGLAQQALVALGQAGLGEMRASVEARIAELEVADTARRNGLAAPLDFRQALSELEHSAEVSIAVNGVPHERHSRMSVAVPAPSGGVPASRRGNVSQNLTLLPSSVLHMPRTATSPSPPEIIRFQTETGSVYELSRSAVGRMAWRRLAATIASEDLRSEGGRLVEWPEVVVGGRCFLCEPINEPFPRLVSTSFVVAILDAAGRVLPVAGAGARRTFRSLQAGDRVTRVAAGQSMGEFSVSSADEQLVHCGPWAFDRITGIEVDPELGWGPNGLVGTWLRHTVGEDDR